MGRRREGVVLVDGAAVGDMVETRRRSAQAQAANNDDNIISYDTYCTTRCTATDSNTRSEEWAIQGVLTNI